jgi:hypothetical protein
MLGAAYIEGTWIGCYKTPKNENRLTVEHFEQTLDGIAIKGYAFTEGSDKPIVDWTSKAASVDGSLGVLTYSYTCNSAAEKTSFEGIADFKFERAHTRKPPKYLNGYSADLIDGIRSGNRERLLSREQIDLQRRGSRPSCKSCVDKGRFVPPVITPTIAAHVTELVPDSWGECNARRRDRLSCPDRRPGVLRRHRRRHARAVRISHARNVATAGQCRRLGLRGGGAGHTSLCRAWPGRWTRTRFARPCRRRRPAQRTGVLCTARASWELG